jgi:hypothetical protein
VRFIEDELQIPGTLSTTIFAASFFLLFPPFPPLPGGIED